MGNKAEIWWELKTPTKSWRPVSFEGLAKLPQLVEEELKITLARIADLILAEIKFGFHVAIRQGRGFRERNSGYHGASPIILMKRMVPALTKQIMSNNGLVSAMIFDLGYMDQVTRREGRRSYNRGWFLKFADGHAGFDHGSWKYGFCSLERALDLAERCIRKMDINDSEAASFRQYVRAKFKGKHNEGQDEDGIMVKLDEPLFFNYPQFGKARKFIRPHGGYRSWPVFDDVTRRVVGSVNIKNMILDAITRAMDRME